MGIEYIICIIGFVVIIYFCCKPKPEIEEDNLTDEIKSDGLPPSFPPDGGGTIT